MILRILGMKGDSYGIPHFMRTLFKCYLREVDESTSFKSEPRNENRPVMGVKILIR